MKKLRSYEAIFDFGPVWLSDLSVPWNYQKSNIKATTINKLKILENSFYSTDIRILILSYLNFQEIIL